jgi:aromatic-amino-acid transaminase
MSSSVFSAVELAPRDPILGLTETFNSDTRPYKANLGVGVYYDENGKLPLLKAVQLAEAARAQNPATRGYLPIEGVVAYNKAVQALLFGADSEIIKTGRAATFEALGGTGGLRIGADFIKRLKPTATVWISDPSWENHRALFEAAGFVVKAYPYYEASNHGVAFDKTLACINSLPEGDVIVLHACCHNPTGVDMDAAQWQQITDLIKAKNLLPFLDMAYQGFGDGIYEDAAALRILTASGMSFFISSSFSKSFSLYGERVGALTIVTQNQDETTRVTSQVKRVIRTSYSNPPTHGATIVATVLSTPELRKMWEDELAGMRNRIRTMRGSFVAKLKALGVKQNMDFVVAQRGMFSYSGLSSAQVDRLREEFAVYAIGTGRICVAALNNKNIDPVCEAVAKVMQG